MTEYWLQKKTIGGWSTVTWYSDQEQAQTNYDRLRAGIGYSYRLVSVETVQEHMLAEVVEIEAPILELNKTVIKEAVKIANSWGNPPNEMTAVKNSWNDVTTRQQPWDAGKEVVEKEHGLSGSVWVVHHANKHKARVSANELDGYLNKGYEKAGPRTQFRE